jgi:HTH-type transcriptional regulator, sugar sensing transcriptional regulator
MIQELIDYGLSPKEVEVYLAGLKAGLCTAATLSKIIGISRPSIYDIIESLNKKGLVSIIKKEKNYFKVIEPDLLLERLDERREKLKKIIPELIDITDSLIETPKVEFFEGKQGIKNAVEDMLKYKKIIMYGASKKGDDIFGSYTSNFALKRAENKVYLWAIIEQNVPIHMIKYPVKKYTKIKTSGFFKNHDCAYFIYSNKIIIISLKNELTCLRITSKIMAESQKKIFNYFWKNEKKT